MEKANLYLDLAIDVAQDVKYDEENCLNNMPENLENTDKYINMEKAIDYLEDAIESIKEARDYVSNAINC